MVQDLESMNHLEIFMEMKQTILYEKKKEEVDSKNVYQLNARILLKVSLIFLIIIIDIFIFI